MKDCIYFTRTRPRNLYEDPYENITVILPPGSRADLAVRYCIICIICNYYIILQMILYLKVFVIIVFGQVHIVHNYGFVPLPLEDIEFLFLEVTNTKTIS